MAPPKLPPEVGAAATCSACNEEMFVTRVKPLLFSWGYEHLTLACRKCGATKTLTIKSS